ncbi:MAG TPA: ShlB/FhaC/HecB family hemolysin secretion/activation protein [Xanthomonadaceae bacterium]|nr:ShlB/FhaC/HecB family hemolysin secretion/activation protein [Xanthomonadaceae bacterium]
MNLKIKLLPLALLAASPCLLAQQIPGAGTQLNQIQPQAAPQQAEPQIRIEKATSPTAPGAASISVVVNDLQFSGAHLYTTAELLTIARFTPGSQLTLSDLQVMASRITEHYRSKGYFVARAYLPEQDISSHVVTIAVVEGNYGKVTLRNRTNLSDGVAHGVLNGLNSGDVITIQPLDHRLLLLSDIPGVKVTSTLVPGSAPGSSDLFVDLAPGPRVSGDIDLDNNGNPYTGVYRLGLTVNVNDPLGRGDMASFRAVDSFDGLEYGRAAYQMLFGPVTAGIAYSRLDYHLGQQFDVLEAHGTADVASIFGSVPLIRSRDSNLYVGIGYDDKTFDDKQDLFPSADRMARDGVVSVFSYGNHNDHFGGGGTTSFYVSLSRGSFDIRTPTALALDAATARTEGSWGKLWFNVSRAQRLTDLWSLNASVTGQLASKNLDSSEQLILGGMDAIRGYPQGEALGDEGILGDVELRLLLAGLSNHVPGQVHLLGFVDGGRVTINTDPWYAGSNERTLSDAGVGVLWDKPGDFAVRTYYAFKLGNEDAISAPDRTGRFWFQTIKYF